MVGTAISSKTFGPQMSKVFRLNQVKVDKAADYWAESWGVDERHQYDYNHDR